MKVGTRTIRSTRLFWSLLLGLGLALGLLLIFALHPTAEVQDAKPGSAVALAHHDTLDKGKPKVTALVSDPDVGAPPRDEGIPPRHTPPGGPGMPPGAPWNVPPAGRPSGPAPVPAGVLASGTAGAAFSAPAGGMAGAASSASAGGGAAADGFSQNGALLTPPLPGSADLAICMTTDRVWGIVGAGETATVTVDGTQLGAALADGIGLFWTTLYDGNGDRPNLSGGEQVRIYHNGVLSANVTLRSISGQIDVLSDVVSGTIGGTGFPISVTVYTGGGEPSMTSYSQTVSTDPSGNFTANFAGVWNFYADETAVVAYVENNVEVHRQVYSQRLVIQPFPLYGLGGWTTPGVVVTATVYSDTTTVRWQDSDTTDAATGRYWMSPDLEEGDVVVVEVTGGPVLSRTVDHLTPPYVDAGNDRVTGQTEAGALVRGNTPTLTPLGWRGTQTTTTADPTTGVYTLEFGAIADIMPGRWAGVYVADAEGDDLNLWAPSVSVEVNQTWNEVYGRGPSLPADLSQGWPVTLTLYSAASGSESTYSKGMEWWGWYSFSEKEDGLPDIAPGDVITVESEGYAWQGVVQVQTITVQHDLDADQFTGTVVTPTDRVELWGTQWEDFQQVRSLYPVAGSFDTLVTANSPFTATPAGFDVRNAVGYEVSHRTADDYTDRVYQEVDSLRVWPDYNGTIALFGPPGTPYTITLRDGGGGFKAQLTGVSDEPIGQAGWNDFWSENEQIETGDQLQAQSAAGFSQTVHIPAMTLQFDEVNDRVSGTAPANTLLYVSVDNQGEGFVPTGDSGQFTVAVDQFQDFGGDGDLGWGDVAMVCYINEDANQVCQNFGWPQIVANYDMEGGGNNVRGGGAIPGNTIYITVTHPTSSVIDTGTTTAGACHWCGPNEYSLDFPDGTIVPSNTVTVNWGDGYVDSTVVVTITANPDVDTDFVTGTAPANGWLNANAEHAWGDWIDIGDIQVDASGVYTIDFGAEGWDIQYGDRFNIHYNADHGHQTQYSFWIGAPELSINKWNTPGYARPGGVVVYGINYWNDGNGVATDTLVVDTLPMSTTWAGDTSGFAHIEAGGVITWDLGNLQAGDGGGFVVTLNLLGGLSDGDTIGQNCVAITTTAPGDYDLGNNDSCAGQVDVWDDDVDVGVDKWAYPDDPTPGQEFEYHIDACNNRGSAAGPVWLTDTLPLSTTFLGWRSDNGDTTYWTEVVTTGGQVVLYASGLPGTCERLQFRLLLDPAASISTTLYNHIVINTADDVDSDNDERYSDNGHVSPPRYDVSIEKRFDNGVLVPGGEIYYSIDYRNEGNSAVHVWVTDTLPTGTSFDESWRHGWSWNPLQPATVTDEYVVWDLGVVGVNEGDGFGVQLNISSTVSPGDVLTNCATVGITETEDTPLDNESCVATTIYTGGLPNLYVTKSLRENYEPGHGNINYRIRFGNFGDQTVYDVHLTDTLPVSTSLGWYNVDWWGSQYTDTTPSGELLILFERIEAGQSGQIELSVNLDDPNEPMHWYTNTVEIDTPSNDANPTDNSDTYVAFSGGEVRWVDLNVYGNQIWGCGYSDPVTVTTIHEQRVYGGNCWNDDFSDPFQPGDVVTITAGAATQPVIIEIPDPFDASASSITETVWGQIGALDHEWVTVELNDGPKQDAQTDGSGNYSATFPDIPRGGQGQVRYNTEIDYADVTFHRSFQTQDLIITVDYEHDWVNGNYEPGHTVWLTLTESNTATVKATAVLTTGPVPEWGGQSGFNTQWDDWTPNSPDIVPGDWVFGLVNSASHTTTVRVGTINAEVDVDADTVSGTLDAPWLGAPVLVRCEIHEENGPDGIEVQNVDPDGGSFFCDFGGSYDIVPGTNVAVNYTEPDGDRVQTHPPNPAPQISINKWANGIPGEGGNLGFQVQYWNDGGLAAEDVIITDTLQGMTYITDTSGVPHSGFGSGPIGWNLGTLPPNSSGQFEVFVQVTASAGNRVTNTAQITTSNPFDQSDPDSRESEWSEEVAGNDTHLNVGKHAWTGDPAPGYDFVYSVNVCNNGSTGSSQVILTDTLHLSTTLQSWWGQHPGWTEVYSSSHQLIVSRPSIPGWWCSEVYLRVHLDGTAWSGMSISNTAVISASNDLEDNDNETTWWGNVNDPHTNLNINKHWNWGQLVPGGEIRYNVNYDNNGNVPVTSTIRITDTLPVSTTFIGAWRHDQYGQHPFTPIFTGTAYVIWEINGLDNGYGGNFEIALRVDSDADPGTVLTNTVEISPQPAEDSYDDNVSTWVETLYDHGPNLRVRKDGSWDDQGPNTRRASYWMNVENVGDAPVMPVVITDTYDSKMYLDGGVGVNYWRWWDWRDYPASGYFTVTLESLYGGESVGINFGTITSTDPLPFGLIFTNTAEVTLDPYPDDNTDDAILTTGPDLWVKKDLVAGDLLPGETTTLSLAFGNDREGHEWWWNMQGTAWLTDTLPAGLEFITATLQSCGWCPFTPDFEDGTHYAWNVGSMWTGYRDEIYLTVRITDTATGLDTFTNWVEISSDQPISDTEPYRDNNSASYDVVIALPFFEVGKVYESSRVAGTLVTYTLTVTNTGTEAGTNVVLSDTLPAGLTYNSGGTPVGGDVTWNFLNIASGGGTASGWFNAVLPCTLDTVTNDTYRVVSSDEGVSSSEGTAVSFDTISPTISAGITHTLGTLVEGETVYFTATVSSDGSTPLSYEWDFGDGSGASGLTASNVYADDGTYTVVFTATDPCDFTAVQTITVVVESACTPLTSVSFNYTPLIPLVNLPITFTATISPTGATAPITYTWNFGDGFTSTVTTAVVQHTYTVSGTYSASVTAYNPCTPAGVVGQKPVLIEPRRVFLPLVLRNY